MTDTHDGYEGEYSEVADKQLNDLQANDPALYNDVLMVCESVFENPGMAQSMSAAVQTHDGVVFRLAVPGRSPYKAFWISVGPRIEAVFPHMPGR